MIQITTRTPFVHPRVTSSLNRILTPPSPFTITHRCQLVPFSGFNPLYDLIAMALLWGPNSPPFEAPNNVRSLTQTATNRFICFILSWIAKVWAHARRFMLLIFHFQLSISAFSGGGPAIFELRHGPMAWHLSQLVYTLVHNVAGWHWLGLCCRQPIMSARFWMSSLGVEAN